MVGFQLTSAAGILSLLDETDPDLKLYALQSLIGLVDLFWAEVADHVTKIEILYEDPSFKNNQLAALVASKIYFHLGDLDLSLKFGLAAGNLLDLTVNSEYVETIIATCIDRYIELKSLHFADPNVAIDAALEAIVMRMFKRCFEAKEYTQAIGIAIESYRLDIIEQAVGLGEHQVLLEYLFQANLNFVPHVSFRHQIFQLLVKLYRNLKVPDYIAIAKCLVHLNHPEESAKLLIQLQSGTDEHLCIAYQIAFDIEDNASQDFSIQVKSHLPVQSLKSAVIAVSKSPDDMDTDSTPLLSGSSSISPIDHIHDILSGVTAIKLHLEFLYRNDHTDLLILKTTKNALDSRNSAHHSAITFSNAFQNAGTTSDEFLRQNLEWLSRATNWSKFSATAGLGVIHRGNLQQSGALLAPYLPKEGVTGSAYSEGGALFALGLIHANHGSSVIEILVKHLKNSQSEVLQHGASLGLGVAAMSTGNEDTYENLKTILYNDNAVAGEAAGLAMGLVMLETGSQKALDEMLQYAHETEHEKIVRGLAIGMAMINIHREEEADAFIELLLVAEDPILRFGAAYTISLAYAGTGDNKAIKKLLHIAVSDTSDEVRRSAVAGLGFVLFKTPEHVPRIVQLLSESYNPHVRFGAAMALGIACAGTGMSEALKMLNVLAKDSVDYVRQGALISLGMVLVQHNEASCPDLAATRKLYETVVSDKREDLLAKVGAVMGQGILDAGGRNVTISLQSRSGYNNTPAIVGMALFTQFWNWFPLAHFLSLSFTPTGLLGLNKDLVSPKFEVISKAKPSLFDYPPTTVPPTTEVVKKIATVVLSTTAKSKARAKKSNDMELDKPEDAGALGSPTEPPAVAEAKAEPDFSMVMNFSRVVPRQTEVLEFMPNSRYVPVKKGVSGIVVLIDTKPNEPVELLELNIPGDEGKNVVPVTAAPVVLAP